VKIQNLVFMSAAISQATSSTSNIQSIIDNALADYAKITGIDLSDTPFATTLEQSNSQKLSSNYSRDGKRPSRNIAMAIGD
jgi:hypothetical protein